MGDLAAQTHIEEFVLGVKTEAAVEQLLERAPRIVGFGVYIWNVEETTRIVAMLKTVAPHVVVVLGGPEVSHEVEAQRICALADHVVTGWGDVTFPKLCRALLHGPRPLAKVHAGEQPPLAQIALPYAEYTDRDIAQRHLYVEASRGCPFKCEFCLSALDKTAWPFDRDAFLAQMAVLHARGARQFRFVDRTFNLHAATGAAILSFFLERIEARPDDPVFVHFEVVPDHLPDALKALIARFPPGTLQFEIGIQTFDPEVQRLISRRQDNARAAANLEWLRRHSHAHLHVDLIAGLPGETLESFGAGFDRLAALDPHEIQVGILKRLRGAPIIRHTAARGMRYNPDPPYNVLATDQLDFATVQRLARFARYWDMFANSGRFRRALPLLLRGDAGASVFAAFLAFSDWLYAATRQTHQLAMERQFELLHRYLVEVRALAAAAVAEALADDYARTGAKGRLAFAGAPAPEARARRAPGAGNAPPRQARHLHA
ncbi:MAG: DUF4080 domain-containing protein [Burkholderiales bacterium]|nr:DUF4080 domain-containing protein [Burkholderiales bacterium]